MKKLIILIIILVLSGLGVYIFKMTNLSPKTPARNYSEVLSEINQRPNLPPPELSAWISWFGEDQAATSLTGSPSGLTTILPVWYQVTTTGEITDNKKSQRRTEITAAAVNRHLKITPTIENAFDPQTVSAFLDGDENKINNNIDALVMTAVTNGYSGYDLDWEQLYDGDKTGFNDFVAGFAEKLHQKNLTLSVTLQAKKSDGASNVPGVNAQDWSALGQSADFIRIMCYDFNDPTTPPGPVTPLSDYKEVISYALSKIPPEKIVIGLPTYGYDWFDGKAEALQYAEVMAQNLKPVRDPASAALYIKSEGHTIYFEDAESTRVKITIARNYGLNKFTFWRLGGEDPGIWGLEWGTSR